MKYVIIYWSRYGNGKKIVDYLEGKIKNKKSEIEIFNSDDTDSKSIPKADLYIFSAPTEAFSVQKSMKSFMKKLTGLESQKYALINTHGMKKNVLHKMDKILSKKGMLKVADIDFRVGEGVRTGDGLPSFWEKNIDDFFEKL